MIAVALAEAAFGSQVENYRLDRSVKLLEEEEEEKEEL